ncbi:MAG: DUF29 family protein [Cyanobacteriota bacterium]|nr:DUF29 family protein [Cyanobacteriota bacterium]
MNRLLKDSPSLRNYLEDYLPEGYAEGYAKGRKLAAQHAQLPLATFPEAPIAGLEPVLDEDWLPR